MIIATAGHVDHGKTELVKALTGTDTDRLPEEKARGLSIDLGFAYQALPDNTNLGFVDVPGHEKFIRNMLAGVSGIDLGLLVVAANDGIMPQTREHFAILNLLGIDQCVVAITKIDQVDDDRILEVQEQVEGLLSNVGHKDFAVYPVCARDNEGLDALKTDLARRAQIVSSRITEGHFRMAIDRVFILKGIGLVVTGTVLSGTAIIDDYLILSTTGSQVRVRGIRTHNEVSDRAQAGERCALNIVGRGVSENTVSRGNWLMHPNLYAPTNRIDVDLCVLESESRALKHWTPTHLHIATDHLSARVAILSGSAIATGERGLVQLVLQQDVFVVHGDRFVLRDQSAQRTIAGGHVVDPFSPKRGRARPSRIALLQAMNHRNPSDALLAMTEISEMGIALMPFRIAYNLQIQQIEHIIQSLSLRQVGGQSRQWIFSERQWQVLLNRIELAVGLFHQSKPERPGASVKEIQLALKQFTVNSYFETPILEQASALMVEQKRLGRSGARFHLPTHVIAISEHDRQIWAQVSTSLAPKTGSPLSLHQAAETLSLDSKVLERSLKNAVKIGEMVLIAKNRFVPISYLAQLASVTEGLAKNMTEGVFTVAEFCKQTEVGRNFAIDLLDYYDRQGFTLRLGNNRRVLRPAMVVFETGESSVEKESETEGLRGRESYPGGAPGLQIR